MRRSLERSFAILSLFCMGLAAYSQETTRPKFDFSLITAIDEAWTVVKVLGTQVGSGTLVIFDNRLAVLTNSHILEGKTEAIIEAPQVPLWANRVSNSLSAPHRFVGKVLFDSEFSDFALIEIPANPASGLTPEILDFLHDLAVINVEFCKPNRTSCPQGFRLSKHLSSVFRTSVAAVVDGKHINFPMISPWFPGRLSDIYLSGLYRHAISIPIFGRPGMSGGALYESDRFSGLVAKVNLGGAGFSYAIPVEEIAETLNREYFKTKKPKYSITAKWEPKLGIERFFDGKSELVWHPRYTAVVSAGEIDNSGGETGNGGGGLYSKYWNLEVQEALRINHGIQMLNPLSVRSRSLELDQKTIAYLKIADAQDISGVRFASATPAQYFYFKYQVKKSWSIEWKSEDAQKTLQTRRDQKTGQAKFLRIYNRTAKNTYRSEVKRDSPSRDGSIALIAPKKMGLTYDLLSSLLIDMYYDHPDSEGFYQLAVDKVATRVSPQTSFDIRLPTVEDVKELEGCEQIEVSTPKTLSSIHITCPSKPALTIDLLPVADTLSGSTVQYRPTNAPFQAVVIYDNNHLDQIERIFLALPKTIYEVLYCIPGKDCVR